MTNGREAEVLHAVAQITGSEGDEWMNGWKGVGNATRNCKFVDAIVCVRLLPPTRNTKKHSFKTSSCVEILRVLFKQILNWGGVD